MYNEKLVGMAASIEMSEEQARANAVIPGLKWWQSE